MNTTKLNKNTARAKNWIEIYFKSHYFSVMDFYKSCSHRKYNAETEIKNKMIENDCIGYKVLGGNSSFFTAGYTDKSENILYIETACNTFEIDLRD